MVVSPCLLVTMDSSMIDPNMQTVTARGCQLSLMAEVIEIYEDGYMKREIAQHALRQRSSILGPPSYLPFQRWPLTQPALQMRCTCVWTVGEPLELLGNSIILSKSIILPFFQIIVTMPFSLFTTTSNSFLFSLSTDGGVSYFSEKIGTFKREGSYLPTKVIFSFQISAPPLVSQQMSSLSTYTRPNPPPVHEIPFLTSYSRTLLKDLSSSFSYYFFPQHWISLLSMQTDNNVSLPSPHISL